MDELHQTLQQYFSYDHFRSGQEAVIRALLKGRSALAIFPTGGGKSLCYQLPALLMDGVTLVISPLIALMKDQVESLRARGIKAARLDSSLSAEEVMAVFEAMRQGELKLLFIAPERLMSESFMMRLEQTKIAMLAIDEAHCISEWGHNFRPEYLRLAEVAKRLKLHPVLALTATATPGVATDIRKAFAITKADHIQTPFHRPNLELHITPVDAERRLPLLAQKLKASTDLPAIVYVTLQETAERVATYLGKAGVNAASYHAGLIDERRSEVQERFMRGEIDVMVATIAFGMGIDKADIRAVYHYNLPKTLENYQQEIGRAGRDGARSHCEMLACADDLTVLENFIFGDTPTPQALRQMLDHLLRQGTEFQISHYDLSRTVDIRPLVMETVLTHLELAGVLTPLGAIYAGYRFRFIQPEARILAGHKPERQAFLKALFTACKRARLWLTISDTDAVADSIGESRERVVKALTYLEEAGEVILQPSGVRHRYRLCADAEKRKPAELATRMVELFATREVKDVERLQRVIALAQETGCITAHLLSYFGEAKMKNCGHCSNCIQGKLKRPRAIPRSPVQPISVDQVEQIQLLMREGQAALRASRQVARFLCGITSPATTRDRLTRHDAFGLLKEQPFNEVLEQCESLMA
jgi:ATP-dependent DNA helicase RecQ